jgi:glycosyltransferase involved in cell wall biosynthesis
MKICLLSTSDGRGGGYAAIYRLQQNLKAAGHDSKMLVAYKQTDDPDVIQSDSLRFYSSRFMRLINKRIFGLYNRTKSESNYHYDFSDFLFQSPAQLLKKLPFKPDLFIANWVNGFLAPKQLYELNKITGSPIIWYLMDMAPLTGGCHYSWNCVGYSSKCGNCPGLGSNYELDLSRKNWIKKNTYIQKTNLTIVAPTYWLEKQASEATLFKNKKIKKIMLGVDSKVFKPDVRCEARKRLGIYTEKKIIFFGATTFEKRKGMNYLLDALDILKHDKTFDHNKVMLVIAGDISKISISLKNSFEYNELGFIEDDRLLATAYQAADVFVCPSIEDSGPMMINESIMCGTPVVSFAMGVAFDLVQTGVTGYRAKLKNSRDLASGIKMILKLNPSEEKNISDNCKKLGLKLCSHNTQLTAFNYLFKELVK